MATPTDVTHRWIPEAQARAVQSALTLHPILADSSALERRARIFQALGNETRLKILGLLSIGETCVCNLSGATNTAASTLAHHLRILEDAGLVAVRQEGRFTIYSLKQSPILQHGVFSEEPVPESR